MEELEAAGVIGPAEGTKPRKVLQTIIRIGEKGHMPPPSFIENRKVGPDEVRHDSSYCHHWTDRDAMLHFYVDQLGFAIVSEYDRPERGDILINLRQGELTLELLSNRRPQNGQSSPCPSMRDCVIWPLKWTM